MATLYKTLTIANNAATSVLRVKVVRDTGADSGNTVYVPTATVNADFSNINVTIGAAVAKWYLETIDATSAICVVRIPAGTTSCVLRYGDGVNAAESKPSDVAIGGERFQTKYVEVANNMQTTTGVNWIGPTGIGKEICSKNGVLYFAWLDGGNIRGCTYSTITRAWTTPITLLPLNANPDAHNQPSLLVDDDGSIWVFASGHNLPLHYKHAPEWSQAAFTAAPDINVSTTIANATYCTYPNASFLDYGGKRYVCVGYRGGALVALKHYNILLIDTADPANTNNIQLLYNNYADYSSSYPIDARTYASVACRNGVIYVATFNQILDFTVCGAYGFRGIWMVKSVDAGATWQSMDGVHTYTGAQLPLYTDHITTYDTQLTPPILASTTHGAKIAGVSFDHTGAVVVGLLRVTDSRMYDPDAWTGFLGTPGFDFWFYRWNGTGWDHHQATMTADHDNAAQFTIEAGADYDIYWASTSKYNATLGRNNYMLRGVNPQSAADYQLQAITTDAVDLNAGYGPPSICLTYDDKFTRYVMYGDAMAGQNTAYGKLRLYNPDGGELDSVWTKYAATATDDLRQCNASTQETAWVELGYLGGAVAGSIVKTNDNLTLVRTALPSVARRLDFEFNPFKLGTSSTDQKCYALIGLTDGTTFIGNNNLMAYFRSRLVGSSYQCKLGIMAQYNGGTTILTHDTSPLPASGVFPLNQKYYCTLEQLPDTTCRLSVYTDANRTTHLAGSPIACASPGGLINAQNLMITGNKGTNGGYNAYYAEILYDNLLASPALAAYPAISAFGAESTATETPPTLTAFSLGYSISNTHSLTLTASDPLATFFISEIPTLEGATWGPAPATVTISSAGVTQVYAWAMDALGNISAMATAPVLTDTASPLITHFAATTPAQGINVVPLSLAASDNVGVTGYCVLGGDATLVGTDPATLTWSTQPPTSHTFGSFSPTTKYLCAWAKDAANNISDPTEITVTLTPDVVEDTVPPTITAFGIPATATIKEGIPVTLSATDNVGVTAYLLSDTLTAATVATPGWIGLDTPTTSWAPTGITHDFAASGVRQLRAWVRDAAGNVAGPSGPLTITIQEIATPTDVAAVTAAVTQAILNTPLTEEYAADGQLPTLRQAIYMLLQLAGEKTIDTTTQIMTVKKLDGTTAMTFQLDSATAPKTITRIS